MIHRTLAEEKIEHSLTPSPSVPGKEIWQYNANKSDGNVTAKAQIILEAPNLGNLHGYELWLGVENALEIQGVSGDRALSVANASGSMTNWIIWDGSGATVPNEAYVKGLEVGKHEVYWRLRKPMPTSALVSDSEFILRDTVTISVFPSDVQTANVNANQWFPYTGQPGRKLVVQQEVGIPQVTLLTNPGEYFFNGVRQGQGNYFHGIPALGLAGTTGAGPCVGLIILGPPAARREVWAYHFEPDDHPPATLNRDAPFPAGSTAILFGGKNGEASTAGLLDAILPNLQTQGVTVIGLYNSPGLWVDNSGNFYVTASERHTAENDGTSPPKDPNAGMD